MVRESIRGFVQLPLVLLLVALLGLGGLAAVKLPEIRKEASFKKLAQNALPSGTASGEEILVGFRPGVSLPQAAQVHQAQQATLKKRIKGIDVEVVRLPSEVPIQEAAAKYKARAEVEFAEPNFLAQAFLSPNDPLYNKQWNLLKIASDESFDFSQGGFSKIAVVDTGVDPNHPDLSGLVLTGFNTIDGTENSSDDHGHGTHVAGIAAAQTNNATGVASASFTSTILPIKVLNKDGFGTYADVAEGIVYAVDNEARIINLSLGGTSDSETLKRAVRYAQNKGSLLVAAAGNNGNDTPVYPASYDGVLAVSASDQDDSLASFSSFGKNIFVASPGVSITSTVLAAGYASYNGTSMAAPHLSGLLALALAKEGGLSNDELINTTKQTAEKVGPYPYDENGWNQYFGYGRVSAGKMLTEVAAEEPAEEPVEEPTPTPTPTPEPEEGEERGKVPKEYSFNFELQGEVESVNLDENKFTTKVQGGTPEVLKLISGNLVDVYTNEQTRIKYQGREASLDELSPETKVNVKGNIRQNKLIALEVIIQHKSQPTLSPTIPPAEAPEEGGGPPQLPPQVEEKRQIDIPKGKVRGTFITNPTFLTRVENYLRVVLRNLFRE